MTPAERQAVLETKLENLAGAVKELTGAIKEMGKKIERLETELRDDKADLAQLKNSGRGILIGVAIAATAIGALLSNKLGAALTALGGMFR